MVIAPPAPGWADSEGDAPSFLPLERADELIAALAAGGRRVIGPRVEDGALRMAEIDRAAELPFGWTVRSAPGSVVLERASVRTPPHA